MIISLVKKGLNQVKELFDFINSGGHSVLRSRAASTAEGPRNDALVTEIVDGLIVSMPSQSFAVQVSP